MRSVRHNSTENSNHITVFQLITCVTLLVATSPHTYHTGGEGDMHGTVIGWSLARGIIYHHQLVATQQLAPTRTIGKKMEESISPENASSCSKDGPQLHKATFDGWRFNHYGHTYVEKISSCLQQQDGTLSTMQ